MLHYRHAATKTPLREQRFLDRPSSLNIIAREGPAPFARPTATVTSRGSNDHKAEYREGGGGWRFDRRDRIADGSSDGERRRVVRSARQSGTAGASHRAAVPGRSRGSARRRRRRG